MATIRVTATVPIEPAVAFEGLIPFDGPLGAASSVQSIERIGDGGVGTTYEIELARFGQRGTIATTVTAVDRPASVSWQAEREIDGRWQVEASARGSRLTIVVRIEDSLLDRLGLGRGLLARGLAAVLRRAFRGELEAVLRQLVRDGGGDPARIDIEQLTVELGAR